MNTDLLVPGIIALTIHALILSAPLSRTQNNNAGVHTREPISVCVMSPREPAPTMLPVQASAQVPVSPRSEVSSHMPARETIISKKKVIAKKRLTARNMTAQQCSPQEASKSELAANPDNQRKDVKESSFDQMQEDRAKTIDRSSPVTTASTAGHILGGGQVHMETPRGNQRGQDNIVYAIPKYSENPPPRYPEIARRRGYEGRTILRVQVLESGKAGKIEIEESSGFSVLDTAALESVTHWTFVPGSINGKSTEQWIRVPIRFVLE